MPTLGSLFSGIEGFGLGFEKAGFEILWQVEQEPFCNAVLATHWPAVQRFTDVRGVGKANLAKVDCITAGVPCQDVSVAGRRKGLAGERTGLFYEFARVLSELRPPWFVFENVPGLFSSNNGRDFAEVLRVLMVECGYGVSWRVLDSRYFGVAQRRARVFIVGSLGRPCPAEILFESESGAGDFAPGGEARKDIAVPLTSGSCESLPGRRMEDDWNIVASPLVGRIGKGGFNDPEHDNLIASTLSSEYSEKAYRGDGSENVFAVAENQRGEIRTSSVAPQLSSGGGKPGSGYSAVAYALREDPGGIGQGHNTTYAITDNMRNRSRGAANYVAATLRGGGDTPGSHGKQSGSDKSTHVCAPADSDGVRDFAGLPEGMDSARYRTLGNAVTETVTETVAEWIARRLITYSSGKR